MKIKCEYQQPLQLPTVKDISLSAYFPWNVDILQRLSTRGIELLPLCSAVDTNSGTPSCLRQPTGALAVLDQAEQSAGGDSAAEMREMTTEVSHSLLPTCPHERALRTLITGFCCPELTFPTRPHTYCTRHVDQHTLKIPHFCTYYCTDICFLSHTPVHKHTQLDGLQSFSSPACSTHHQHV